jgi:nucleotide-binding universal stress UspA family protein
MALIESHIEGNKGPQAKSTRAISVKNVLFATDFSPASDVALPYAIAVCRRFGATLHAVHVLSDATLLMMTNGVDYVSMGTIYEDAHNEAKEKLERMLAPAPEIVHRSHVRHGPICKNLMELAQDNKIDLLVLGTHGRGGLGKLLLGSVAENILRHLCCPVLTVGPNISGRAKLPALQAAGRELAPVELEIRRILFATNFSVHGIRAAKTAVLLAEEFRSRLTLLHVMEESSGEKAISAARQQSLRRLQELVPKDAALQYAPERKVEFGSASECILKMASEQDVDLIVLGARAAAEVGTTHLPWSTAHYVLAHAHCPVLTVHERLR